MRRTWATGVVIGGALAFSACSLVLDPEDYVGDGEEDGGTPPPPVTPPPPLTCTALPTTAPGWRGCPFRQQGPASFDVALAQTDLALALAPGGDAVRGFGALAIIEEGAQATIGTFALEDIDLSNPFDLTEMAPMRDVQSVALRAYDDNYIAINVVGRSTDDTTVRAWVGRVSADDAFELNPIYGNADDLLYARAGIVGGYMPSPALQVFPLRHVWRGRDATGERLSSVDESGAMESSAESSGPVPTGERVDVSDSAGQWVALSSAEGVSLWRADADGSALAPFPTEGQTGRAAIAAAATGCHYAVAYPRTDGIALTRMVCNEGCSALERDGGETVVPTEGESPLVAIATMPEGGWVVAAVEARSDGAVVVVRLLDNAFDVQTTLDPLSPAGFGDLMDPVYLDLQVAAAQRATGYHVIVAASHDRGSGGTGTPHWIAAFHGCEG